MISESQSLINVGTAAAISTALFAFGLRSVPRRDGSEKRQRRWLSISGGIVGLFMTMLVGATTRIEFENIGAAAAAIGVISAVALGGALLIRRGLRGKRTGDHPYCRVCGFDLFGKPEGSVICSECGANLDEPRAVVIGIRRRRMMPLTIGLFLVIVAFGVSIPAGRQTFSNASRIDWNQYRPSSWLVSQVVVNNRIDWPAINELHDRLRANKLSASTIRDLLSVLDRMPPPAPGMAASYSLNWTAPIARMAWRQEKIDEATVRKYAQAALDLQFIAAPQAARGHGLAFWVMSPDFEANRGEPGSEISISFSNRQTFINGSPVSEKAIGPSLLGYDEAAFAMKSMGQRIDFAGLDDHIPLGQAKVEMRMTATLTIAIAGRPTLVETRDLVLMTTPTIVEPAAMRCPPIFQKSPNPELPIDDPANQAASQTLALPEALPTARAFVLGGVWKIELESASGDSGLTLGHAVLRMNGQDHPLGDVCMQTRQPKTFDLDGEPTAGAQVIITPTPERGVDMFMPQETYQLPMTISVSKPQ